MDIMNSSTSEFVLLGLTNTRELEVFFFFIFLLAYAVTVAGNLLIVVTVTFDSLLYSTPMYFLLGNLSFLDMSIYTITTPKMVTDLLRENKTISLWGCMAQMFFLHLLGGGEMTLLIVMAVDQYIAICKPLHYTSIMNRRVLVGSVLLSWAVGFVHTMSQMVFTITLPFCGPNIVDDIFCDLPRVLKLACTETYVLELLVTVDSGLLSFICFILLLISYTVILVSVRRRSSGGLSKALSTLSAHISVVTVVTLFFGPCIFIYAWPFSSFSVDKFLSVFYSVITPLMNPIIYTLRNQEMKAAMNRLRIQHIRSRQTF
ncbi:LOW QUALITY PROTEIN: olfactory receptor 4K13-like [Ursus americanus]|uniref:LOW QUALITY PROTEIN: olfactory receptor 4K13-like n=1 Tax=Ursus americanus TaxID=9643 RepID=UPI001E67DB19|nr:LOW QUALITY PROTEIN: olfactory receptor 4K13-like [Ursus americanus]